MRYRIVYSLVLLSLLFGTCTQTTKQNSEATGALAKEKSLKYAKRFAINKAGNYTLVYLFGNKNNHDTTTTFIVYTDSINLSGFSKKVIPVKRPCLKIAALSSIYASMLCELGVIKYLAAIDNIDYVNNSEVIAKHQQGNIQELAKAPEIDLEKTISLKPDMIFTFGMGEWSKDRDERLMRTGIPVAVSVDHLEESPLARAEWIKFFAVFVDKETQADSIFDAVENRYLNLKELAVKAGTRPTVFNEIKYSDSWYMPGGKSYVAQLLNDAGANYLWKDNDQFGSLPLSFEQVYAKAKDADYWINLSVLKHKRDLLGYESRYEEFKAFKTGNLYNNTRYTNAKGYSDYWETGMIYPDRILSDLILIFHPELKSEIENEFYYYEQIK